MYDCPLLVVISTVGVLKCLKRLVEEARADEQMVVSLWKHEMQRLYRDTLCRHSDILWFDDAMNNTINEVEPHPTYVTNTVQMPKPCFE